MKKNNKGFTLLETLIVSTFVLGSLIYLFTQINNAKTNYDITFRYDSVNAIYNTKNITYFLRENGYSNLISLVSSSSDGYIEIYNNPDDKEINSICLYVNGDSDYCALLMERVGAKTVLFTSENMNTLKSKINNSDYSEELKRYILQLDFDQNLENMYRIIVEYNDNTFSSLRVGWEYEK